MRVFGKQLIKQFSSHQGKYFIQYSWLSKKKICIWQMFGRKKAIERGRTIFATLIGSKFQLLRSLVSKLAISTKYYLTLYYSDGCYNDNSMKWHSEKIHFVRSVFFFLQILLKYHYNETNYNWSNGIFGGLRQNKIAYLSSPTIDKWIEITLDTNLV